MWTPLPTWIDNPGGSRQLVATDLRAAPKSDSDIALAFLSDGANQSVARRMELQPGGSQPSSPAALAKTVSYLQ
jgi:hypothetical protein